MGYQLPIAPPVIDISLASRGISKGLSQTKGPQGIVRVELPVGEFYLGGYVKNVTSTTSDGEAGLVVGVRKQVAGFALSASATWRFAVHPTPGSRDQTLELAGTVARKIGRMTPQVTLTWSPDDPGATRRSLYAEAGATYAISAHAAVGAAVGRRDRVGAPSYTAFNAGLTAKLTPHLTLDLRYYGTDRHGLGYTYQPGPVAALRLHF
jgi:uncharacterized protein (TIGR02001 family)